MIIFSQKYACQNFDARTPSPPTKFPAPHKILKRSPPSRGDSPPTRPIPNENPGRKGVALRRKANIG